MAQIDTSSLSWGLKIMYDKGAREDLVYDNEPLFGLVPKNQKIKGKSFNYSIQHGVPIGGRSATFADALAGKDVMRGKEMSCTLTRDYNVISIDRLDMMLSDSEVGAYFNHLVRGIDGMLKGLTRSVASDLFRNGGGAKGRVGSVSTTRITLLEVEDVAGFEVGQEIVASANDGSAAAHVLRSGSATITAVDRDAGTIDTDSNWTAQITGLTANDYLFCKGDFKNKLKGLAAHIPTTAPSSGDSFFGVDRSEDVTRLAGCRLSATTVPVAEAIKQGIARLGREGWAADKCWMSHNKALTLSLELDNRVEYVTESPKDATVGFTGFRFVRGSKPLVVMADHNCPDAQAYLLSMDSWQLISAGPVPELQENLGNGGLIHESTSDGFEVRGSSYSQLVCFAPAKNLVLTLE